MNSAKTSAQPWHSLPILPHETPAKRLAEALDSDDSLDSLLDTPQTSTAASTSKRFRTSLSTAGDLSKALELTSDEIVEMGANDELVGYFLALQSAYSTAYINFEKEKKKKAAPAPVVVAAPAAKVWTPDEIEEKAEQIKTLAVKEIKKQMKWRTGIVPCVEVLKQAFNLPEPKNKREANWKQKKLSLDDFRGAVGSFSTNVRYGTLTITGSQVTLAWSPEDSTFSLRGTYGLGWSF
ncbi:hypothetical protein JCM10212_006625 [Sporobolomyces blumeae]